MLKDGLRPCLGGWSPPFPTSQGILPLRGPRTGIREEAEHHHWIRFLIPYSLSPYIKFVNTSGAPRQDQRDKLQWCKDLLKSNPTSEQKDPFLSWFISGKVLNSQNSNVWFHYDFSTWKIDPPMGGWGSVYFTANYQPDQHMLPFTGLLHPLIALPRERAWTTRLCSTPPNHAREDDLSTSLS